MCCLILRVVASNPEATQSGVLLDHPHSVSAILEIHRLRTLKTAPSLALRPNPSFLSRMVKRDVNKPSKNRKQKLLRHPADVDPPLRRHWLPSPRRSLSVDRVRSSRRALPRPLSGRAAQAHRGSSPANARSFLPATNAATRAGDRRRAACRGRR